MTRLSLVEVARLRGSSVGPQREPVSRHAHVNGVNLHYLEWGQPELPTLLLLHSAEETAHSWDLVGLALSDRYHVVALDSRGVGGSERGEHLDYRPEAFARDIEAFVDHLRPKRLFVAGQAWGARFTHIFAGMNPDKLEAAVIIDTAPEVNRTVINRGRAYVHSLEGVPSYEEFVDKFHPQFTHRPREQVEAMLWHELEQKEGAWTWRRDLRILSVYPQPAEFNSPAFLWSTLARMKCKTLIVRGANSYVVSEEMANRIAAAVGGAEVVTIPNAGHLVAGDNPAALERALLQFLDPIASRPPGTP